MRTQDSLKLITIAIVIFFGCNSALAQTMPPLQGNWKRNTNEAQDLRLTAFSQLSAADQKKLQSAWKSAFFPLIGASSDEIQKFYQASTFSSLQQTRFLYGFGQSSKSLSVDLASMLFPHGTQLTLGNSVTAPGKDSGGNSNDKDSPAQAIERLKAGGDFFIRAVHPVIGAGKKDGTQFLTLLTGRVAYNISGFGSESTITESTERNYNLSVESYFQTPALNNSGLAYISVKTGLQNVQDDFARSVGLRQHNFGLSQVAFGFEFAQLMRVGLQHVYGPSEAFNVTTKELSKWHLVVQLVPPKKAAEKNP